MKYDKTQWLILIGMIVLMIIITAYVNQFVYLDVYNTDRPGAAQWWK